MRLIAFTTAMLLAGTALAAPGTTKSSSPSPKTTAPAIVKTTEGLKVTVEGINEGKAIPAKFALCQPSGDGKSKNADNMRPTISWSAEPTGTKSFAVIVKDPDVPADFTDAGKDGKVIEIDAKRQPFYHWALADIPADRHNIPGGPSDKPPGFGKGAKGSLEKYVKDPKQYGGPCPPWNDMRIHHYYYTVYALDTDKLDLPDETTAKDVEKAALSHSLGYGVVYGTYTTNRARGAK